MEKQKQLNLKKTNQKILSVTLCIKFFDKFRCCFDFINIMHNLHVLLMVLCNIDEKQTVFWHFFWVSSKSFCFSPFPSPFLYTKYYVGVRVKFDSFSRFCYFVLILFNE